LPDRANTGDGLRPSHSSRRKPHPHRQPHQTRLARDRVHSREFLYRDSIACVANTRKLHCLVSAPWFRAGEVLEVVDSLVKGTGGRLRFHYSIVDVVCKYISGSPRPGDDVSEVAWVPVEEALRMPLAGVTAEVLKKATKLSSRA